MIKANNLIEMQKTLSNYQFPRFEEEKNILLTDEDCQALIQEIKLQINDFLKNRNLVLNAQN